MSITIQVQVPEMTPQKYAQLTGLKESVVKRMAVDRNLPTIKAGRYNMINVLARFVQLGEDAEKMLELNDSDGETVE